MNLKYAGWPLPHPAIPSGEQEGQVFWRVYCVELVKRRYVGEYCKWADGDTEVLEVDKTLLFPYMRVSTVLKLL